MITAQHAVRCLGGLAALAAPALAQGIQLNEIYISHSGTDDQEFIELVGPAGASLDDVMVLVVEGEIPVDGTLDRVWDLTGLTIPADGYFVLGVDAVAERDFDIGTDNAIENGTETFYVLEADDPAAVTALLGTVVKTGPETTSIPTLGAVLDSLTVLDEDPTGEPIFDGSDAVGPDPAGPFFPAGVYRAYDFPRPWCQAAFLDFDDVANVAQPRTPGAPNGECPPCQVDAGFAGPGTGVLTVCGADLSSGTAADVVVLDLPPGTGGVFFLSTSLFPVAINGGTLAAFPPTATAVFGADANGEITVPGILNGGGGPALLYLQFVYVDSAQPFGFGFTNAVEITLLP